MNDAYDRSIAMPIGETHAGVVVLTTAIATLLMLLLLGCASNMTFTADSLDGGAKVLLAAKNETSGTVLSSIAVPDEGATLELDGEVETGYIKVAVSNTLTGDLVFDGKFDTATPDQTIDIDKGGDYTVTAQASKARGTVELSI